MDNSEGLTKEEQQKEILQYLKCAYTGARTFYDFETMVKIARAIEAFEKPVELEPEEPEEQ